MKIVLRGNVRKLCLNNRGEFCISRNPWKIGLVIGNLSDLGRQPLSGVEGDAFRADGLVQTGIIPIIQNFDHTLESRKNKIEEIAGLNGADTIFLLK